jgi:hypothetical protein
MTQQDKNDETLPRGGGNVSGKSAMAMPKGGGNVSGKSVAEIPTQTDVSETTPRTLIDEQNDTTAADLETT